jgi:hypothetical protein
MRGRALRPTVVSHRIKEREMTTTSSITAHAAQARTDDLVRAAAASRAHAHRSPRSTFGPLRWLGRRPAPAPPHRAAPTHP